MEEWKDIAGYEKAYQVSSLGRVRRLPRSKAEGRLNHGRILMPQPRGGIYLGVHLHKNGKLKTYLIHRLVLFAFRGAPPPKHQSRHMDGDSHNNWLSNLMWGTSLQNHADKIKHGTSGKGEKNGQAKLKEKEVIEILNSSLMGTELAEYYAVTPANICSIRKGKSWGHLRSAPNKDIPLKL